MNFSISVWRRDKVSIAPIVGLLVLGTALVAFKFEFVGLTPNSDYESYQATSALFRGAPEARVVPERILKPLEPAFVAAEEAIVRPQTAFAMQAVFFYFLLLAACYAFGRAFGFGQRDSAFAALLLGASYPVLKYGLDLYTETGALFFYIGSLALTLLYLRAPSARVLAANIAVITLGFFWKEYSAVAAAIFGCAILFHPSLSWRVKVRDLAWLAGVFIAANLAWEILVYAKYHYTYLAWYRRGGAAGFATEFTLRNLAKSIVALIGLAWLIVPFGLRKWRAFESWQRQFFYTALPLSCMALAWGYVSSRLFFVMAPACALLAVVGISRVSSPVARYGIVAGIVAANLIWLIFSHAPAP